MSMNLHAEDENGREIELWQTPTWVTYMCIDSWKQNGSGKNSNPLQRKWKDTRKLYLEWVRSRTQGVWKSTEEYEDMRDTVKLHVDEVMNAGKLTFFIM